MTDVGYLDAIFVAIRAFTEKLVRSQQWLTHAEETTNRAWRLSFLREARRAYEAAGPHLGEIRERLGPPGEPSPHEPSPLEQLQKSLVTMQSKLDEHERRLIALESELAFASGPIGNA